MAAALAHGSEFIILVHVSVDRPPAHVPGQVIAHLVPQKRRCGLVLSAKGLWAMQHFLVFEVGGRRLGLSGRVLREVIRAVATAPLPKAPPIVEGVINLRGVLVPVLDIRQRFALPPVSLSPEHHFLIAQADGRLVALHVDRALDLITVDEGVIESVAGVASGAEHVAGIVKLPDGLLIIHDLERFLSLDESRQVDAALAAERAG